LAEKSTSPTKIPATSERRPPVPNNSSKTNPSWLVPNLVDSMSMNRKSGTTMSRTRSNTASADTVAFAMGLTVNTSSSNSHPKNALMTDQCVLIVIGASPARANE
jgi:hypothetical protein